MEAVRERGQSWHGDPAQGAKPPRSVCRKSLKPLIKKHCHAWINASLEQLRRLLQQTPEQQNTRALSCLEKAEILEMTIQQLARLKKPDIASKNGQDFAAGYCHCLNAVSTFLSSVGSLMDQNIRSHILHQLETTTEMKAAIAPTPSPKVWQPQDAGDLSNCTPDVEALVSYHLKKRTLTVLGFSMGQLRVWKWGQSLLSALCFPEGWSMRELQILRGQILHPIFRAGESVLSDVSIPLLVPRCTTWEYRARS